MKLTTQLLLAFVGGQMEIVHPLSNYHYIGQLREAVVNDERYDLQVTFEWLAQGVGEVPHRMYVAVNIWPAIWRRNLAPFTVLDIGADGLRLSSSVGQESVFFFPRGYHRNINPSMVEGLTVPS